MVVNGDLAIVPIAIDIAVVINDVVTIVIILIVIAGVHVVIIIMSCPFITANALSLRALSCRVCCTSQGPVQGE